MADNRYVKGMPDLKKFFQSFPDKIAEAVRGGLHAGMETVKPVAQANINSVSGDLAAGLKVSTSQEGDTLTAHLRATGPGSFKAKWVEFGTQAHRIEAKDAAALSINGKLVDSAMHPGARPHPFMRPALDGQAGEAVAAAAEYTKNRLESKE